METYSYSAERNAFYANSLKVSYSDWPEDAVKVSAETFNEYSRVPPEGKNRVAGPDGLPAWADIPPPTAQEATEQAQSQARALMQIADGRIRPLNDAQELGIATDEETAQLKAWKTYRVMLNRVDTSAAPDISWPAKPQ